MWMGTVLLFLLSMRKGARFKFFTPTFGRYSHEDMETNNTFSPSHQRLSVCTPTIA
jgi:hypothetical protein